MGFQCRWRSAQHLAQLEIANAVVLRGVNCLVKARMAFQHGEFAEAAVPCVPVDFSKRRNAGLVFLFIFHLRSTLESDKCRQFKRLSVHATSLGSFYTAIVRRPLLLAF
jgi:hypothetical protein